MGPRWVPDTRQTGRLTVGHNIALTLSPDMSHLTGIYCLSK
jgi:hypothetical protein